MLFKLSLQNIRKSVKDYAVYFFTLILGVTLFYVFNAIESQSVMMQISERQEEILELLATMLSSISVFVALILGFLIIYANRFLMKRRSREFGLYLLLGMGKRKVSLILFFETVMIGLISIIMGLLIGVGLSQITSILVANMFEVDLTEYRFIFSGSAACKTVLFFAIIYVVMILFNTISINKCRLIDLFYVGRRNETAKLKNPRLCTVVFVLAAGMLGTAYYRVVAESVQLRQNEIVLYIVMGCIGTFLFFWSVSGLLLQIISGAKNIYYKDLNSFVFHQMSSKINTNVCSMTVICLMLFVTTCVLTSALNVRNSIAANIKELAPADIELIKSMDRDASYGYTERQLETKQMTVLDFYTEQGLDLTSHLKEWVTFPVWHDESCTLGSTLGDKLEQIQKQFIFLKYDTPEDIMRISDYNKVAALYGRETFSLGEGEYLIVSNFDSMIQLRNQSLAAGEQIRLGQYNLKPAYPECQAGFVDISSQHTNTGIIIVPDEMLGDAHVAYDYVVGNYLTDIEDEVAALEQKIEDINTAAYDTYIVPALRTKNEIRQNSKGLGALIAFVGLYIGLVFLIASSAVLALKELSESVDNIQRFQILRKLGADEGLIRKALFRQIGIFFLMPMLLALFHSIFGMMFSTQVLEIFGVEEIVVSLMMTAAILLVVYGGYFIITYLSSRNMISE